MSKSENGRAVVTTSSGKVSGYEDRGVKMFKGIPYGAPPVGVGRYRPPLPPEGWDGVRSCVEPGPSSIQNQTPAGRMGDRYRVPVPMSEDCLYLNVWTPGTDDAARPVVIFIHGGGYGGGSGAVRLYDGTRYARDDTVFLTINYRLGGLGFIHLDELFPGFKSTGNLGILDAIRALEWVQENIAAFGGDPGNVTLTGSSSGGISAAALMASPKAEGLFHRAVVMSCAAGHTTMTTETATKVALPFLDHLGVKPGDVDALLALPAEQFAIPGPVSQAMRDVADWHHLCPINDGDVLHDAVVDAVAAGSGGEIDLLIGHTEEEQRGSVFADDGSVRDVPLDLATFSPRKWSDVLAPSGRTMDEIREVYYRSLPEMGREANEAEFAAALSTDYVMSAASSQFAAAHSKHAGATYAYRFHWRSPRLDGFLGSFHGLATPFFFDHLDEPAWAEVLGPNPPTELAANIRRAVVALARSGNPNHDGLPEWPSYDTDRRATMILDETPHVVDDPKSERRELFEGWYGGCR